MASGRRTFLKTAALGGAALGLPAAAVQAKPAPTTGATPKLPPGRLCVLAYGRSRVPLAAENRTQIVSVDLQSGAAARIPSPVSNLHSLLQAGPNGGQWWGVGHESPELIDVFDGRLQRLTTMRFPGIIFRGHGIAWKGGVLVAAERQGDPMAGGLLLHLDPQGQVVGQHPTGGMRPHEVVECGDYLAVAHYGNRPKGPPPAPPRPGDPATPCPFMLDTVSPGVSFLRRDSLEVVAFYRLPGDGATSHLGVTPDGQVLAMSFNALLVPSLPEMYAQAGRDGATLLSMEVIDGAYEIRAPMYRVDPLKGLVETLEAPAASMRRGQSFAHDLASGTVAATYAASQTVYLQRGREPGRWLSTLNWGVANPRGCALLAQGELLAVSGHDDNIAIVDITSGELVRLIGVPLGGHSHMYWLPG
ncbi:hypothetical protein D3C71_25760 [compost metagenome]